MTDLPFAPDPLKQNKNVGGHPFRLGGMPCRLDTGPRLKLFLDATPLSNGFQQVTATSDSGTPLKVCATAYAPAEVRYVRLYDPSDTNNAVRELLWVRQGGSNGPGVCVGARCRLTTVDRCLIPQPLLIPPVAIAAAQAAAQAAARSSAVEPEPSGSASSSSSAPSAPAPEADTKFCTYCEQQEPCECPECGCCPRVCRCEKKKGGQASPTTQDRGVKRSRERPNVLLFRTGYTDEIEHPGMERVAWCHEWGKFQLRWVYKSLFRLGGEYRRPLPSESWRNAANKTRWTPAKQPDPETGLAEYTPDAGDWGTTEHQCYIDFLRGAIVFDAKGRQIGRTKSPEYTGTY